MKKSLSPEEIIKLEKILNKTKKRRIKYKLISRICDGTIEYYYKWLEDDKALDTDEDGFITLPTDIELALRYYKKE